MDPGEDEVCAVRSDYCDSKEAPDSSPHSAEPSRGKRGRKSRWGTAVTSPDSCDSRSNAGRCLRVLRARGGEAGATSVSKNLICMKKPDRPLLRDEPRSQNPSDTREKSRQQATAQQQEVKKEESEEEEGRNDVKKRGRQPKDDKGPRQPKRRKKPPVQYVRCEMEGCGTVLAHPRYLQHHIKYQHLLKKNYVCDHPSCGRLFRLQKQLLRHAKHHTDSNPWFLSRAKWYDQRDYICEYCARAFKSSHNLAVHRMIHTGEKPIQCEICGFTCRQKASLNWHMKKHDAEASYQFSCSICGKKFEKKDSVIAHKAKSHPEVLIAEALAANGGSVISGPAPVSETVPVVTQPDRPFPINQESKESQEVVDGTFTPLQQVVLPLAPQSQIDVSEGHFLQLPVHHVVQLEHQQQAHTLLHLTTAPPPQLSTTTTHPQLTQLPILPASTVASVTTANPQSTLLTLSSVPALASQQDAQWGRGADVDSQIPGEGELWQRVIVDTGHEEAGEMMWENDKERRKEDEGIVWGWVGHTVTFLGREKKGPPVRPPKNAPVACGTN
ncbi:hypothetical protein INR49_011823 [Caranx melampygus]|nr:hypothetical protein INR49_011823 [Caranx melampygus]